MAALLRMWMVLAALCAGILHLGLVHSAPPAAQVLLILVAATELGWAVIVLVRGRISRPRTVLLVALTPTVAWGALVALAAIADNPAIASYLGFAAMFSATVFELFVAAGIAVSLRRGATLTERVSPPSAPLYLAGILAGALLASVIVSPALASTDAGKFATPASHLHAGR